MTRERPRRSNTHPLPCSATSLARSPTAHWQARKEEKPLVVKTADVSGTIDSSLYESVSKAGESGALVSLLVDLFAWDINFYIDTHPGDHWKVVVEKQYLGGQFYKYGSLLAAEYGGKAGTFRGFYWNPSGAARPRALLRRKGPGSGQEHAQDAAALRAHQLEVRPAPFSPHSAP